MNWKFDQTVASNFATHARQHIPNYDQVINNCIEICQEVGYDAKIIDVGCAIGETLSQLNNAGFTNLHGVDNSQAMLDQCPPIAKLTLSDTLPQEEFDVVLMNWTLHFINHKELYLQEIFDHLVPGGILVLTEKTSVDPDALKFYHKFKSAQGVSNEDIIKKSNDIKDVMFVDNPLWYLTTLKKIGFDKIFIINAFWCFTTFVCIKDNV